MERNIGNNPIYRTCTVDVNKVGSWRQWKSKQVIPSLFLCIGAFACGMNMKSTGPSLLDLQLRTDATIEQVSWYFSAKAIGSLVGGLILGKVIDHKSRWLQISIMTFINGVFFGFIPWITVYEAVVFLFSVLGFSTCFIITSGQVMVYLLWNTAKDSIFWQNIFQFTLCAGAMFGPIVVQPFLVEKMDILYSSHPNGNISTLALNSTLMGTGNTHIMFGYLIGASFTVAIAIFSFIIYCAYGGVYVETRTGKANREERNNMSNVSKYIEISLLFAFHVVNAVLVRVFSNYLPTFVVNYLEWTKAAGAHLTSVYFASSVIFKIFVIFVVRCIKLEVLLFSGLLVMNIATVTLALFAHIHNLIVWIFAVILAFGTTTSYSVLLAWTDRYMGITGYVGIIFSIAGSVGEMIFSSVVGYLFHHVSYVSFMYLVAGSDALCLLIMLLLQYLVSCRNNIKDRPVSETDPLIGNENV